MPNLLPRQSPTPDQKSLATGPNPCPHHPSPLPRRTALLHLFSQQLRDHFITGLEGILGCRIGRHHDR